jgi:hypothetical protein
MPLMRGAGMITPSRMRQKRFRVKLVCPDHSAELLGEYFHRLGAALRLSALVVAELEGRMFFEIVVVQDVSASILSVDREHDLGLAIIDVIACVNQQYSTVEVLGFPLWASDKPRIINFKAPLDVGAIDSAL